MIAQENLELERYRNQFHEIRKRYGHLRTTTTLDRIRQAGADVWRPRPFTPITQWMEDNFRLSPLFEGTDSGGAYSLKENPFWREPLEMMQNKRVRQISMKKSTQVGGTLTLIGAMLAFAQIDAAPAMVVTPDEISCIELRDRLYSNAEESTTTAHMAPPERYRNTRHIDLGACRTYMAWAGSAQRLRGRACKRVYRSEIDVWAEKANKGGNPLSASSERVKRFFASLIYDESSPSGDQSAIAQLYDLGDRRQWWCRCLKCGRWQVLRFFPFRDGELKGRGGVGGLIDADGNFFATDEAIKNVHYICVGGCKLPATRKDEFVRTGFWLPDGLKVDSGCRSITPKIKGISGQSIRHVTYHLWSIHSPTVGLDKLVAAYLDMRTTSNLRKFFEDWLGNRFQTRRSIDSWEKLSQRLTSHHTRGTVPSRSWFLTTGVDVQQDGCYWVVRAWGDQSTSWLVDWGYQQRYFGSEDTPLDETEGVLRSDLRQLVDAVIDRRFPIFDPDGEGLTNPLGQRAVRPLRIGIDSNYYPRDVHQFVFSTKSNRVECIRGDHTLSPKERFRHNVIEKPKRDGPAYIGGGMPQWGIYTTAFKETIRDTKWSLLPNRPGAWLFPNGIHRIGRDYLRQIVNERPIDEIGKNGRRRTVWKVFSDAIGNHYWDCEIYAFAMAEIVLHLRGQTWDAATWIDVPLPQESQPHEQHIVRDDQ